MKYVQLTMIERFVRLRGTRLCKMQMRAARVVFFCGVACVCSLVGCTYYVPTLLETARTGDTLDVAITGHGSARWDPERDSLVIVCSGCSGDEARIVDRFDGYRSAEYLYPNAQELTLTLWSMGTKRSVTLAGNVASTGPMREPLPARARRMHRSEEKTSTMPKPEEKEKTVPTPAPTPSATSPASVRVTATEGVAIYTDKTKTTVLKIVPQGTVLPLLSKEGDLYSVSIDGTEGFVDAEAVQEQ